MKTVHILKGCSMNFKKHDFPSNLSDKWTPFWIEQNGKNSSLSKLSDCTVFYAAIYNRAYMKTS